MPTNVVWIIERTFTTGTQADINDIVQNLQPQYTLTPLSAYDALTAAAPVEEASA